MAAGIATWLATASKYGGGVLNVTTTGELLPCMWGTIVAAFVPAILSPLITYLRPQPVDFAWERFNNIKLIQDDSSSKTSSSEDLSPSHQDPEKLTTIRGNPTGDSESRTNPYSDAELRYMNKQSHVAGWTGLLLFVAIWILWPLIMYAAHYEFSRPFFIGWVVVAIIWAFAALLIFTFLPLFEDRKLIARIAAGVFTKGRGQEGQDKLDDRRGSEATTVTTATTSKHAGKGQLETPGASVNFNDISR